MRKRAVQADHRTDDSARERSAKPRILLVEDHTATANAIGKYLRLLGYTVQIAQDVRCARELAGKHDIDVLVADIALPDGTGWDLMRELRRDHPIRGIAISGFAGPADLERSTAAGFALHLAKPLSPDELTDALESLAR